ncbi:Long-chain-fatty-acid--CoA ligase [Neobacillus rhizosphaerae]|uniref:Long-chain-fatty-acid--CoA ligase n=1 Tax=Neobacillus rhizosphaerae TaxID=2880965 RepID=A0ABM9ELG8_9BACI|nr:long-chain fatty acid--CoA ligase [Neobacillus rhizosphaerae]CAH2713430.1 Long-chain-fatty-acid--CoA ligase [Neobacillus rhizosphaerae]
MVYQQKPWLKWYDPRVEEYVSVEHRSLYNFLESAVNRFTDKPAFTFFGRVWSYTNTKVNTDQLASALHNAGFLKGDRLAIMLPNTPHYIFTLFAAFRLGGIAVQVNPMYVEKEIEHVLQDSGAEYMVVLDTLYPKVKKVQPYTSLKKVIVVSLGRERINLAEDDQYFDEFLQQVVNMPEVEINPYEDVAVLQYTGGTTGAPKGVMLTHNNLLANFNQICNFLFNTRTYIPESFKMITVLPMFHVYGLSSVALCGLREGANQIVLPRFDVKEVMELVKREKPFLMAAVPTMYFALNSQPGLEECGFDDVYYVGSGGAPLPVEQVKTFEKITGATLFDGYGLSEAAPTIAFNPPFVPRRYGSIGIPVQSTVVRIVRQTEDGFEDVPVGEAGELLVKGPQVMKGYWNRPKDTEEVLKDGWLLTGDIAKMDEDGYFYILDRKKDMIIASGYNVYPREIEEVLYQLEGVEEALVIGVPDEYRGETVKAFIKLKEGYSLSVDEIIQFANNNLSPYKAPKVVEILADLPKSSVGKLLRRVLRDEELAKVKA